MALVLDDRVQETTTTTGTGTLTLAGAVTGYQSFAAIGNANTTYYCITDGTNWEVGLGTYTSSGTTLARTTVIESSNSNSLVNFPAGSKNVFVTYPASKSVNLDASGNVPIANNLFVGTTTNLASANGICTFWPNANVNTNTSTIGAASGTGYHWSFNRGSTGGTEVGSIRSTATTSSYVTTSDYRLKENIEPMQNALVTISQLNPCTYTWKIDGSQGQGFIAHELQAVVPDAVSGEKDAVNEDGSIRPQGVDTSFVVATLVAAIQELSAKVTALEAQVEK
jgi:hypothetical protein